MLLMPRNKQETLQRLMVKPIDEMTMARSEYQAEEGPWDAPTWRSKLDVG